MVPIQVLPATHRRLAPLIGSLAGATASGLAHAVFLVVLGVIAVSKEVPRPELQIRVAAAADDQELEELVTEQVRLEAIAVERPEFEAQQTVAGNQSELADLGGATDAQLAIDLAETYAPSGLLDTTLRRSLLDGFGGPGSGTGRASLRDGSFSGLIEYATEHGLDVVIVMDTTGSMKGEIDTVKKRIAAIGGALLKKVPEARISIVSYKDEGDDYVAKGLPLTRDLEAMQQFLEPIKAGGGGDTPEAVEAGLQWAISNNEFRQTARKVILLFGDQPPHDEDFPLCISLVENFRQQQGVVNTITCRRQFPIPHYRELARAGGGEAFTLKNSRRIMEELLVLMFGDKHRQDVVEFFELELLE